jgi:GT2 family glycosyltransferase
VKAEFPDARIIHGAGNLYWNGAMRAAIAAALSEAFDFYLLLNDDTILYRDAVATLLDTSTALERREFVGAIIVGSTEAPDRSGWTYGGWRLGRGSPLHMERVAPASGPSPCDTFNANCVLVPAGAMRSLGNLDRAFTHSMGDLDLGLRARRAGIRSFVAPGFVGACEPNESHRRWKDDDVTVMAKWRRLLGPKGVPPREWLTFTARHAGPLWPLYYVNPYLKFWVGAALRALRERTKPRSRRGLRGRHDRSG